MKPPRFAYVRPDSIDEALEALAETGADASLLAGGMSLGAMLNMRLASPDLVIDINRIPGQDGVEDTEAGVRTGCLLRQADAMRHSTLAEAVPLLALALPHVGHMQTRNRGTLCGSVAHADPSAEVPLCLVALGGAVELASRGGSRRVAAAEFFEGLLTTARRPDEMITGLLWPRARPGTGHGFAEIAQRRGDYAIAAAAWVRLDESGEVLDGALAFAGVEDRPRAFPLESASAECARALAASLDPISDRQADAGFRRHLGAEMAVRALAMAVADTRQ